MNFSLPCTFTVGSYNSGGLPGHYDYQRACVMQKIMSQRYEEEPELMQNNFVMQKWGLKKIYQKDPEGERTERDRGCSDLFAAICQPPKDEPGNLHFGWFKRVEQAISSYKSAYKNAVRIFDLEVKSKLENFIGWTRNGATPRYVKLEEARRSLAGKIFEKSLTQHIVCLQEANFLQDFDFPSRYEKQFSRGCNTLTAVLWDKNRFRPLEIIHNIANRAIAVLLEDRFSGKTILVASAHLTGCNPYREEIAPNGVKDSEKGDAQLQEILERLDCYDVDLKILAIDANVTSLHPRLQWLPRKGYWLDCINYLYPTCTNPYYVLDTRIDWIAVKVRPGLNALGGNLPIDRVRLNGMANNMSDHRPIALEIRC